MDVSFVSYFTAPALTSQFRFQEQVMSFQTIVFTNHRVFFRCFQNVWGEDIIFDNFPSIQNESIASGNDMPNLSFTGGESALVKYISTLSRYHDRRLTKGRDAVNAFTGVLRQLCIRLKSDRLCGLPTFIFDLSLLFWHFGRAT
jgi:hypothetical protein